MSIRAFSRFCWMEFPLTDGLIPLVDDGQPHEARILMGNMKKNVGAIERMSCFFVGQEHAEHFLNHLCAIAVK